MGSIMSVPVLVLGGGTGGVAAALALARHGIRCAVSEPTGWIGGQLTSQAVPPDENRWIEAGDGVVSATASYLDFRRSVRDWYRTHSALTPQARKDPLLNPGGGWVSRLCFEPRVGHTVLRDMLAEHVSAGRIKLLLQHEPIGAQVHGDRVTAVTLLDKTTGNGLTVEPEIILEATEAGDLYPLAGIEHTYGAEHRDTHGELHGRADHADPNDQQAITWCFAMEHRPGEDHVIDKPDGYDFWRSYVPPLEGGWPGPLFSWDIAGRDKPSRTLALAPWPDRPQPGQLELWRYRRIVNRAIYQQDAPPPPDAPPDAPPEVSLFNCVQMDYFQKPILGVSETRKREALKQAKRQSLCFFYWMQTEAPRHDSADRLGYPGLRLRGEEIGSSDGFALAPYIREPRRLAARTVVTEAHVGQQQRLEAGHPLMQRPTRVAGEPFTDSVGIGHYAIDLHPSAAMRSEVYVPACPFRVPLGALLPVRVRNVVAAGKAIGVTHVANGCTRLHPVEWNVGEAAGVLASLCLRDGLEPAQVHGRPGRLRELQGRLAATGVPLTWPWEPGL
jgi:FAD dependent oxidoreductase